MDNDFDLVEFAAKVSTGSLHELIEAWKTRFSKRKNKQIVDSAKYMMDTLGVDASNFTIEMVNGLISISNKIELDNPLLKNMIVDEVRKQLNLYNITDKASDLLETASQLDFTNEANTPNQDWINSFKDKAKLVSDDEMQDIWAKVLAGEFEKPGKYSIRTLEFLSSLSKKEAELITKAITYSFFDSTHRFIIGHTSDLVSNYAFTYEEILLLEEIGILSTSNELNVQVGEIGKYHLNSNGKIYIIVNSEVNNPLDVKFFTKIGFEISHISDNEYEYTDEELKKIFNINNTRELFVANVGKDTRLLRKISSDYCARKSPLFYDVTSTALSIEVHRAIV